MIEKILFNLIAIALFVNIFLLKLVKKNDTTYLSILVAEAIGIAISFISIVFDIWDGIFIKLIMYLLAIIFPIAVIALEKKGINISDYLNIFASKLYMHLGNTKKAKDRLVIIVTKYPKNIKAHKMLAEIYEKEGGIRKAIDEYMKVIQIKKDAYDIDYKVAFLLTDLGRNDDAINVLNKLLEKKPDYIEATNFLGELLCKELRYKEAVSVYSAAINFNPNSYDLFYNLGLTYTLLNDFSMAKECYNKAAQINHELYNAKYCLGKISLLYRDVEQAEKFFSEALMGELEADAYYELAKLYMIENEKDKAITFVNKAIELDGKYVEIVKQEPIFIMVRQYINLPINALEESKKNIELPYIEKTAIEHLDDVFELTKSLSVNEIKRNFAERISENENEYNYNENERQKEE